MATLNAKTCVSSDSDQSSTATEQLQAGDIVGFDDDAGDYPLAIGTILLIKAEDKDRGTDGRIVVQVGPKVLGIYRTEQLVRLRNASQ